MKLFISSFVFTLFILTIFSWLKDYEIKIDQLEAKEVCIESHPYLNREWTQITCGKVVTK